MDYHLALWFLVVFLGRCYCLKIGSCLLVIYLFLEIFVSISVSGHLCLSKLAKLDF